MFILHPSKCIILFSTDVKHLHQKYHATFMLYDEYATSFDKEKYHNNFTLLERHLPKQTGLDPLHVPLAWQTWLSSPSRWWSGLQVYVTMDWYLVSVVMWRYPP